MSFGGTTSMALIIFPIFLLVFVGVPYNSLINSGLTGPGSGWTGCPPNSTTGPCSLSSSVFVIFQANSPFTDLFTGNFLGLVSDFFPSSNQVNYYAQPQYQLTNSTLMQLVGEAWCNEVPVQDISIPNTVSSYVYSCDIKNSPGNWFTSCSPSGSLACAIINPVKDPFGGDPTNATGHASTEWAKNDTTFYLNIGSSPGNYPHCWDDAINTCYYILGITPIHVVPFNATYAYKFNIFLRGETYSNATNALSILGFLGFIAGAIIILALALGIGFGATFLASGIQVETNEQGTRLAQVVGFGLLVFLPIYSEFGAWLGALTFGTELTFILLTIFGIGIFWRSMSLD